MKKVLYTCHRLVVSCPFSSSSSCLLKKADFLLSLTLVEETGHYSVVRSQK